MTIYLKIPRNIICLSKEVLIGDIAKIHGPKELVEEISKLSLYTFTQDEKHQIATCSVLKVIEIIQEAYPSVDVENIGESDFVLEYLMNPTKNSFLEKTKLVAMCLLVFFGAGFTIMAFNNDIGIMELFAKFYGQLAGTQKPQISELEIMYCVGLVVGVLVFFNHVGKKKITMDPTPIQVEFRKYEKEVDATFIENAGRKGHNIDVE